MKDDLWFEVVLVLVRVLSLYVGGTFGLYLLPLILHSCFGVPYID